MAASKNSLPFTGNLCMSIPGAQMNSISKKACPKAAIRVRQLMADNGPSSFIKNSVELVFCSASGNDPDPCHRDVDLSFPIPVIHQVTPSPLKLP